MNSIIIGMNSQIERVISSAISGRIILQMQNVVENVLARELSYVPQLCPVDFIFTLIKWKTTMEIIFKTWTLLSSKIEWNRRRRVLTPTSGINAEAEQQGLIQLCHFIFHHSIIDSPHCEFMGIQKSF